MWLILNGLATDERAAAARKISATETLVEEIDRLCAEWNKPDAPGLSVAVARGSTVLYERAVRRANLELGVPTSTDSVFQVVSVSKPFTAMSVLGLHPQAQRSRCRLSYCVGSANAA